MNQEKPLHYVNTMGLLSSNYHLMFPQYLGVVIDNTFHLFSGSRFNLKPLV